MDVLTGVVFFVGGLVGTIAANVIANRKEGNNMPEGSYCLECQAEIDEGETLCRKCDSYPEDDENE